MKNIVLRTLLLASFVLVWTACKRGFVPINYGSDACANCKMTIVDENFAAEIVTEKGRAYKFDDLLCLKHYVRDQALEESSLLIFVADFTGKSPTFLDATTAVYLRDERFSSPMNGNVAAFESERIAEANKTPDATSHNWTNLPL